ncbi:MAG: serine/threonine protein kinase [Clostridiales bacterium]|nr:serine/threonine protein kinase [Clostridiales bacterium]
MVQRGQVIADRYTVIKEIGSGGTSVVYLASDNHLNKNFAIKEICKEYVVNSSDMTQSLIDEANIMNRLNHPLLPRIIDVIDRPKYVYVVMDYIQGQPLNKVVAQRGKIPEKYVVHWFRQLCEVLTYLHTSNPPIIFRDLKPSNIILTPDGSIRLIDFGAAKEYKSSVKEADMASNYGTRGYAAPEQLQNGITDARTDIYSLGVTMHYLLTGVDPTDAFMGLKPIRQIDPSLSPELEAIIDKCTNIDSRSRYANCKELFYELNRLYRPEPAKSKGSHAAAITSGIIAAVVFVVTMLMFVMSSLGGGSLDMITSSELLLPFV